MFDLQNVIKWRANKHLDLIKDVMIHHNIFNHYVNMDFILAGGCFKSLDRQPKIDYGIFLLTNTTHATVANPIAKTNNAITIEHNGVVVQLCNYSYDSLADCVNSFDLSYCRCGVLVHNMEVLTDHYTSDYVNWVEKGEVVYNKNSSNPFSSLLRAAKIYKQGLIDINTFRALAVDIIGALEAKGIKHSDLQKLVSDNPNITESEELVNLLKNTLW